jgi:hypothetical protein
MTLIIKRLIKKSSVDVRPCECGERPSEVYKSGSLGKSQGLCEYLKRSQDLMIDNRVLRWENDRLHTL